MARKRKPGTSVPQSSVTMEGLAIFETALYGRLSVLDNGKIDGDSLESQIALMEQYVAQQPYLHYVKLYQDNGYTGTNFDRPAWDELIRDVRAGRINCIVVKDLSRLGRNLVKPAASLHWLADRFVEVVSADGTVPQIATETLHELMKASVAN